MKFFFFIYAGKFITRPQIYMKKMKQRKKEEKMRREKENIEFTLISLNR